MRWRNICMASIGTSWTSLHKTPSHSTRPGSLPTERRAMSEMSTETAFLLPIIAVRPATKLCTDRLSRPTMSAQPTRRTFLSLAASTALLAVPGRSRGLSREEAEREARLAYASLPELSDMIDLGDYNGFRMQLRTGAMSRVRASCSAWYRSFEPGDQRAVAGERLYGGLIKAVEAADIAALKAERGGDRDIVPGLVRSIGLRFEEFLGAVGE